jgi:acetyl-CoA carboxylase biotin carboxyl carrier protein
MDFKEIKRLINIVEEAQISHFSIETDGMKIKVKKELSGATTAQVVVPQAPVAAAPAPVVAPVVATVDDTAGLTAIKAEMVGTFYDAPSPESPTFVKVGDTVSVGKAVCIIEAMKLFNEIVSEVSGTVEKVCVAPGDAVEFGQTLFLLRS